MSSQSEVAPVGTQHTPSGRERTRPVGTLDPDDRVLAALAERYPQCSSAIVSSSRLRMAVGMVRTTTGAAPDEIVEMLSSRELDTAQRPVGVLVSRCSKIIQDAPAAAEDPAAAGRALPAGKPGAVVPVGPAQQRGSHQRPPRGPRVVEDPVTAGGASRSLFAPSTRLHDRKAEPQEGWRRTAYRLTGGVVNPGPGAAERQRAQMIERVRQPVPGYRNIAVLSMNGGVGKTTVTAMVGHTFARYRGDRVVAIDASPHPGTLAHRIPSRSDVSVRDLLAREEMIQRYADVRSYASQASSRLEVVASDSDPRISSPFDGAEYERASALLSRFYTVILTDCGPGMLYPSMASVLAITDQIVVVTSPTVDGARAGGQLLDWLEAHGCGELVVDGVVVINAVRRRTAVDVEECTHYFSRRVREVRQIPYDHYLAVGSMTSLESVAEDTQQAYLDLSASVADAFGDPLDA